MFFTWKKEGGGGDIGIKYGRGRIAHVACKVWVPWSRKWLSIILFTLQVALANKYFSYIYLLSKWHHQNKYFNYVYLLSKWLQQTSTTATFIYWISKWHQQTSTWGTFIYLLSKWQGNGFLFSKSSIQFHTWQAFSENQHFETISKSIMI